MGSIPLGVHTKLDRAQTHLEALEAQARALRSGHKQAVVRETPDNGRTHLFVLRDPPIVPDDMSAVIGDCIHNLRSALDHLAYELVPNPTSETTFPICTVEPTPPKYASKLKPLLAGTTPAVDAIVRGVQPYQRRDGSSWAPLHILHELDIIDKHRELLPGVVSAPSFGYFPVDGVEWYAGGVEYPQNGDPVAICQLGTPDPDADLQATFLFYVRLKPAGTDRRTALWSMSGVDRLASDLCEYVTHMVVEPICSLL